MVSIIKSMSLEGLDGYLIEIQTEVSTGIPNFEIVGLPDASIKEAKERIRAAIKNTKFEFLSRKVLRYFKKDSIFRRTFFKWKCK